MLVSYGLLILFSSLWISFEHEYVELDNKGEEKALVLAHQHDNTVWNAKVSAR